MKLEVAVGPRLEALVRRTVAAGVPFGIVGGHGIGKSQLVRGVAADMGIGFRMRDLSLHDALDLAGLVRIDAATSRTVFAPPAWLPRVEDGERGILFFDELARIERSTAQPLYSLLVDRTLGDYTLPDGWVVGAAWNEGEYAIDRGLVDQALRSRFLVLSAHADPATWAKWAADNDLHPRVVSFVRRSGFTATATPRGYTLASRVLAVHESDGGTPDELVTMFAGVLPETVAVALASHVLGGEAPLTAGEILLYAHHPRHRETLGRWRSVNRYDMLAASCQALLHALDDADVCDALVSDPRCASSVDRFLADLPADLRRMTADAVDDVVPGIFKRPRS